MNTRPNSSRVDNEILEFIIDIYEPVQLWKSFHFPLQENGYAYFDVQGIKKYGFQFLDRIILTERDGKKSHGTIIGEHAGLLYINLDTHYYAQAVSRDENKRLPLEKDTSGVTEFDSIAEFQHKYLGFYLTTHNQYLKDLSEKKKGFKNNFWAAMERNKTYIDNTKVIEKTLPRIKLRNK